MKRIRIHSVNIKTQNFGKGATIVPDCPAVNLNSEETCPGSVMIVSTTVSSPPKAYWRHEGKPTATNPKSS